MCPNLHTKPSCSSYSIWRKLYLGGDGTSITYGISICYCSLSFYTRKNFWEGIWKHRGVEVIAIMISVSGELVLLIRLLWIRFLTPLHRISWKSHQPAGKENPISSGQWLRDIDCVFLHLEASSQVGGHSESHSGCHIGSLAGGHGSWGPLKGYFIHHEEGIWNYGNDDEREMDG